MNEKICKKAVAAIAVIMMLVGTMQNTIYAKDNPIGDLRWDFVSDAEGFTVEKRAVINGVSDGALSVTSTRDDPIIRATGLHIVPKVHRYLRFRIKNNTPSDFVQFYMFNSQNKGIYISKAVVPNSDEFIEYEIDIPNEIAESDFENYTDVEEYTRLRFDPMNKVEVHTVEIDYIILSRYSKDDALPELVKEVYIGNKKVRSFESSAANEVYFETNVLEETYNSLTEENIAVTFGDEYPGASVCTAIKEVGGKKIIDITAQYNDAVRTYRIVCTPTKKPVFLEVERCEIENKRFTYSGYVKDENDEPLICPITVMVRTEGSPTDKDIKYVCVVFPDENGVFGGRVNLYDPEIEPLMYRVEVVFDADGAADIISKTALYMNKTKINSSLDDLKKSSLGVLEFMAASENAEIYEKMGIWLDLYNIQSLKIKDEINQITQRSKDSLTAENASEIVNGGILAKAIENIGEIELKWRLIEIDENIKAIEVNNKRFGELGEKSQNWVAKNLKANNSNGTDDHKSFYAEVRRSMLIDAVNNSTYMELRELLLDNTDILEDNMSRLANETDNKIIDNAMKSIVLMADKSEFTSVKTLINAVNSALTKADEKESDNSTSSGKSGGGGGKMITSGNAENGKTDLDKDKDETEDVTKNTEDIDKPFNDMTGYEWAENAAAELYKRKVISGVGNGLFEPGRTVMREEFIKMLVNAFDIKSQKTKVTFDDVGDDDWFMPYVSGAVENGIITGISEKQFGTGMQITREDMAVMIYRAALLKGTAFAESGTDFNDSDEIAGYAKESVSRLSGIGIVNGAEDGKFKPKAFATRAEAACIIYRCMEEF